MIAHGLPIYVARAGRHPVRSRASRRYVREKMQSKPRSRALFVFVGKRKNIMKVLTWDGSRMIMIHKRLDADKFELPMSMSDDDQYVVVSDAIFEVIYKGVAIAPRSRRRRVH